MKKLVLLLFMFVTISMSAQRIDKPGEPYYAYCELYMAKNNVHIILGKNTQLELLYDDNGEILKISRVEVINYMGKRGWEYVGLIDKDRDFHLFKKKVKNDKEILANINIKPKK